MPAHPHEGDLEARVVATDRDARYLPTWRYVPDRALEAILDAAS